VGTQPTRRHVLPGSATETLQAAASRQRLVMQSLGNTGSSLIVSRAHGARAGHDLAHRFVRPVGVELGNKVLANRIIPELESDDEPDSRTTAPRTR
jgi:hypothetical protein